MMKRNNNSAFLFPRPNKNSGKIPLYKPSSRQLSIRRWIETHGGFILANPWPLSRTPPRRCINNDLAIMDVVFSVLTPAKINSHYYILTTFACNKRPLLRVPRSKTPLRWDTLLLKIVCARPAPGQFSQ